MLSLSDDVVRVTDLNSTNFFNVHKSLLTEHAPHVFIREWEDGKLSATIQSKVPASTVEIFVNWLYTRETPADIPPNATFETLLPVIRLASDICGRDTDFPDVILDRLIDQMVSHAGHFSVNQIIDAAAECLGDSEPWEFFLDFLVHSETVHYENDLASVYKALEELGHDPIVIDLAAKICKKKEIDDPGNLDDLDLCKMIMCGFFAARESEGGTARPLKQAFPWETDRCRFHRHTVWDLPCCTIKR